MFIYEFILYDVHTTKKKINIFLISQNKDSLKLLFYLSNIIIIIITTLNKSSI